MQVIHLIATRSSDYGQVELQDFFEHRTQRRLQEQLEAERLEEELAAKQRRERQAELVADQRQRFYERWITYAVEERRPWDAPDDYALLVTPEVLAALSQVSPDQRDSTVEVVVNAAISRALAPWNASQEKRRVIEQAVARLPIRMRWADYWNQRARTVVAEAIGTARDGASTREMLALAELALHPLTEAFQHTERIEEALKLIYVADGSFDEQRERKN